MPFHIYHTFILPFFLANFCFNFTTVIPSVAKNNVKDIYFKHVFKKHLLICKKKKMYSCKKYEHEIFKFVST